MSLLPLIYTNAVAAGIFLAACLIWNVPEMIGMIKQTAKVSRKEESVKDGGSMGILMGLKWVGFAWNFWLAGWFQAAALSCLGPQLFAIVWTLFFFGVACRCYA